MGHPLHVPRDILIGRAPVTFAASGLKGTVFKIQNNLRFLPNSMAVAAPLPLKGSVFKIPK